MSWNIYHGIYITSLLYITECHSGYEADLVSPAPVTAYKSPVNSEISNISVDESRKQFQNFKSVFYARITDKWSNNSERHGLRYFDISFIWSLVQPPHPELFRYQQLFSVSESWRVQPKFTSTVLIHTLNHKIMYSDSWLPIVSRLHILFEFAVWKDQGITVEQCHCRSTALSILSMRYQHINYWPYSYPRNRSTKHFISMCRKNTSNSLRWLTCITTIGFISSYNK